MHLERLILVLEIVAQKGEASVADICDHSDLPKATSYRLVQDLVATGLLEPVSRGRFAIGARLRRITSDDQSDHALIDLVAPTLRQASDDLGVAFFLSRLRARGVEIIHVETPKSGVSFLHPGLGKRPLHACSCSKVIAAFSPDLLDGFAGRLRAYTDHTLTNLPDLEAELAQIRARGFGECVEELEVGMCSVAAPVALGGETAAFSIGATGSVRVFTPEFRERIGQHLTRLAAALQTGQPAVPPAPRKSA